MRGSQPARMAPWLTAALAVSVPENRRILVIDPHQPLSAPHGVKGAEIGRATLVEVDQDLLARLCPDVVLAPLMTQDFDILDLARRLRALGYRGRLRAYAPRIPDPHLVQREISAACPGLDFDLIVIDTD